MTPRAPGAEGDGVMQLFAGAVFYNLNGQYNLDSVAFVCSSHHEAIGAVTARTFELKPGAAIIGISLTPVSQEVIDALATPPTGSAARAGTTEGE